MSQLTLDIRLDEQATFENYVADNNRELVSCLQDNHWLLAHTFIYLWGEACSGCSHLLQSVCHDFHASGLTAIYLPLAAYAFSPSVLEGLERLQLVCIDDIDRISGDAHWEQALCSLYNACFQTSTVLLVSSHARANQINCKLKDWSSRLLSALHLGLKPMSDGGKILLLSLLAKRRGLVLTGQVGQYLLNYYSREPAYLMRAISELDRASWVQQRRLTIPFVKQVLHL